MISRRSGKRIADATLRGAWQNSEVRPV